jgi:hypothetical protein
MNAGDAHPEPVDLRIALWAVAVVLACVELCLELI